MGILSKLFSKSSVKYVEKTYRQDPITGEEFTYEVYRAESKDEAMKFLKKKVVNKKRYYIEVDTPESTVGKDIMGIY